MSKSSWQNTGPSTGTTWSEKRYEPPGSNKSLCSEGNTSRAIFTCMCLHTHSFPTGMKRWHSCQQRFTDGKYRWHLPARWNARHVFLTGASLGRARIPPPQSLLRSHRGEDPRPRLTSQQNKTAARRRIVYSRWYHIIGVLAVRAHACSSVARSHNTRTHGTKPYREPKTLPASHAKGVKSLWSSL